MKTNVHQQVTGLTNYGISTQWYTSQQCNGNDIYNNMDKIQTNYAEWKMPEERVPTLWFHSHKILENANIHSDKRQISNCTVKELDEGMNYKEVWRNFWGWWNCLLFSLYLWFQEYICQNSSNWCFTYVLFIIYKLHFHKVKNNIYLIGLF